MAAPRFSLSYSASYVEVSGSLTWTQRRDNLAETDDNADSHTEEEEVNQFLNWVLIEHANFSDYEANGHGQCSY